MAILHSIITTITFIFHTQLNIQSDLQDLLRIRDIDYIGQLMTIVVGLKRLTSQTR